MQRSERNNLVFLFFLTSHCLSWRPHQITNITIKLETSHNRLFRCKVSANTLNYFESYMGLIDSPIFPRDQDQADPTRTRLKETYFLWSYLRNFWFSNIYAFLIFMLLKVEHLLAFQALYQLSWKLLVLKDFIREKKKIKRIIIFHFDKDFLKFVKDFLWKYLKLYDL